MLTIHAEKSIYIVNLWSSDGEKVGGAIDKPVEVCQLGNVEIDYL